MAHSLEPAPQQPRPRPRNGIRGLAAIARTHPRRAMMDVVHFSLIHATMSVDELSHWNSYLIVGVFL